MTNAIKQLPAHLQETYGVDVTKLTPLEPWAPDGVQRVDRSDGPAWVARVFGPERPRDQVHGDAEILRFLEGHDFPAERCAHEAPVSSMGEHTVLVTECLDGQNARQDSSAEMIETTAELLGRLHSLPKGTGAVARRAGGWHHLSVAGGGRAEDIAALLPVMETSARRLPKEQLDDYTAVVAALQSIDTCEDLPTALINVDFGGPNIMKTSKGPVVVDWTGSGTGPRVLSMPSVMGAGGDARLVDGWVAGYSKHAELTKDELDRLDTALPVFSIVLLCWSFAFRNTPPADVLRGIEHEKQAAAQVAALVRKSVEAKRSTSDA